MALGIAAQLPDSIPDHMNVPGRSQKPGPVTGQIECLNVSWSSGGTQAGLRTICSRNIPGPYTVLAITYYIRTAIDTPALQFIFDQDSDGKTASAGANDLLTADVDLTNGLNDIIRSGDADMQQNKRINEDGLGSWLCIMVRNAAGDTSTDLSATVWYVRHDHINADTVDD